MSEGRGDGGAAVPVEPPFDGDEVAMLLGALERQRATFAWKCGGLDAAGMRATLGPSTMTLGGLVKHMAAVEDLVFTTKLHGEPMGEPWQDVDWEADPDWEWHSAAHDPPEALLQLWREATARSRASLAEALARGDMGQRTSYRTDDGRRPNLRRIVVDLIEEYARHVGHADLLREAVDGLVGDDPPEISGGPG